MNNLELKKIANNVRKGIVTSVHSAKAGHPGGSLSAADIFTYLYFEEMNIRRWKTEIVSFYQKAIRRPVYTLHLQTEAISR